MLCSAVLAALLLLLAPPEPSGARSLHPPKSFIQVMKHILEHYKDHLTLDDLQNPTSDPSEEALPVFDSELRDDESPEWIEIPVVNENRLRLLKEALASQKRALSDRSRRGWNRGCFGLKLDRIGSMSGLGC